MRPAGEKPRLASPVRILSDPQSTLTSAHCPITRHWLPDLAKACPLRISVDDCIQAGYAARAEEGVKALKIDRLRHRLGATKGNLCWHFTEISAYRAALVEACSELHDEDRRDLGVVAGKSPRQRLSQTMTTLVSARYRTLERAMRE